MRQAGEVCDRWLAENLVDPQSPAEAAMLHAIGVMFDLRPGFVEADTLGDAEKFVRGFVGESQQLLVFPQVRIEQYRPDFLVYFGFCGSRFRAMNSTNAFLVEVDGAEHHGADRVDADLEREESIFRKTGLPMLRFSGAETAHGLHLIEHVLSAKIEMMAARRQSLGLHAEIAANRLDVLIQRMACHPRLRRSLLGGNRKQRDDPYDGVYDPAGYEVDRQAEEAEAEFDPWHALTMALNDLRYAVDRQTLDAEAEAFRLTGRRPVYVDPVTGVAFVSEAETEEWRQSSSSRDPGRGQAE